MNILFVIPRFPSPPLKGDQLIVINRLKGLSKNFKITALVFYDKENELKDLESVAEYCEEIIPIRLTKFHSYMNVAGELFRKKLPFQVSYYYSEAFRNAIRNIFSRKKIDLVHVFTIRLAEYTKSLDVPVIYELIDSMQLNVENMIREEKFIKKWLYRQEQKRINKYEDELSRSEKFICVVSDKDKKRIGNNHIKVIPNGVDTDKFIPSNRFKKGEIIFTGNMGYLPNVHAVKWFVRECFPIILQAIPYATFRIVGANPSQYIKSLHNGHNIFVTGYVKSIVDELNKAQIAVAPMRSGSGMQNKIIEAMSCGVPVVTTHNGLEGLFAEPGEEILVSDTSNTYAQSVINLLSDQKLYNELSDNSRKYVFKFHSWKLSNERISDLYLDAYSEVVSKTEKKTLLS